MGQGCSCKKISGETLVTLVNDQNFFLQVIRKILEKNSRSRKFFKNLVRDRTFSRDGGTRSTFSGSESGTMLQ